MKKISVENLNKTFFSFRRGKVRALKDVNFSIDPGKFFVLLGPSGCGKSTLLNIIAGIEKPTEGEIFFGEEKVVSLNEKIFKTPKQRSVAMVFQSYALYPHMTVFENIAFPLKLSKMKKEEIEEKVKSAAEVLEIKDILDAKPAELSGGQRQRVALGRAIVRRPNVLLLDEPLSNLDAMLRITMRSEIKRIQREFNLTTVYVTHDQVEAMSLGDQIAVLESGSIHQIGSPEEIYDKPKNLFVARFVGSPPLNIFEGELSEKFISEYGLKDSYKNKNYKIGVRPENVKLVPTSENGLEAKITMIGSLGSEAIVYLNLNGTEILAKYQENPEFNEGDKVKLSIKKEKTMIFDQEGNKV